MGSSRGLTPLQHPDISKKIQKKPYICPKRNKVVNVAQKRFDKKVDLQETLRRIRDFKKNENTRN